MVDCPICRHPQRAAIDSTLTLGWSNWEIAAHYHVAPREVWAHHDHLERARETHQQVHRDLENGPMPSLLGIGSNKLFYLTRWDCFQALEFARQSGDSAAAQAARRQIQSLLTFAARADSLVDADAGIEEKFLQNPKWTEFKTRLLSALEPYPDAYRAVMESLDA